MGNTPVSKVAGAALAITVLALSGCDSSSDSASSRITGGFASPDTNTSDPVAGAALGDRLLVNADFENGTENWEVCRSAANISSTGDAVSGTGALSVAGSDCAYQLASAVRDDNYELTCSGKTTGEFWSSMALGYLDENYQPLEMQEVNFDSQDYSAKSIALRAPTGSRYVEALLYSESQGYFDNCSLTDIGSVAAALPNMLENGNFERGTVAWINCAETGGTSVISTDAFEGAGALDVAGGGCMYQEIPALAAASYTLECQSRREGAEYASIELQYTDAAYNVLGEIGVAVEAAEYSPVTATLGMPANSAFVVATLYGEARTLFDDCRLMSN